MGRGRHTLRRVLIGLVAVIAVAAAVFVWADTDTFDAHVTAVGLSPDRTVIWVELDEYYTDSCHEVRPEVSENDDAWRVRVVVEQVDDLCTAEAAVRVPVPTLSSGALDVPDGDVATPSAYVHSITLEAPVPDDVEISAGP